MDEIHEQTEPSKGGPQKHPIVNRIPKVCDHRGPRAKCLKMFKQTFIDTVRSYTMYQSRPRCRDVLTMGKCPVGLDFENVRR